MTTYCECGDVATVFNNDQGSKLPESMCLQCYIEITEKEYELFGEQSEDYDFPGYDDFHEDEIDEFD